MIGYEMIESEMIEYYGMPKRQTSHQTFIEANR